MIKNNSDAYEISIAIVAYSVWFLICSAKRSAHSGPFFCMYPAANGDCGVQGAARSLPGVGAEPQKRDPT